MTTAQSQISLAVKGQTLQTTHSWVLLTYRVFGFVLCCNMTENDTSYEVGTGKHWIILQQFIVWNHKNVYLRHCWHINFHFVRSLSPIQGHGGLLEPIPALFSLKAGIHLDRYQSIAGPHTHKRPRTLSITATGNLESPINLTCMSLDTFSLLYVKCNN